MKRVEGFRFRGIAAYKPVPSERPYIAALGECGLFQFRIHIKIVLLHIPVSLETGRTVSAFVKAREGQVERLRLQEASISTRELPRPILRPSPFCCRRGYMLSSAALS